MLHGLKNKKGAWVKPGAGGSYRSYIYVRAAPAAYPTTSQQKAIGDKGRCVGRECKGKTGSAFKECRHKCVA